MSSSQPFLLVRSHVACPGVRSPERRPGRDVLWTLVETVLWFPRGCGRDASTPPAASTGPIARAEVRVGGASLARHQLLCVSTDASSTRYGVRVVRAVTNLPTAPPLKPGQPPADLSLARACRQRERPPAYAASARSIAPAGTVPSRAYRQSAITSLRPARRCRRGVARARPGQTAADTIASARSPAATSPTPKPFPPPRGAPPRAPRD